MPTELKEIKRYTRSHSVPVVAHGMSDRKYVLTVRDLPEEDKPREKLIRDGARILSLPELLAVVLNTGTKKEGVLEMTSRIVKEYGEKSLASEKDPKVLSEHLSIPILHATQIVASVELGRRLFERPPHSAKLIRSARDVFNYAKGMRDLPKEHLRGIYLNSHYKVIYDEVISVGTIDASIIHPREVFKPAIEHAAVAVVLVHNHPSGVLRPSEADIEVTRKLVETGEVIGIELIDHVIISKSGYASIMGSI